MTLKSLENSSKRSVRTSTKAKSKSGRAKPGAAKPSGRSFVKRVLDTAVLKREPVTANTSANPASLAATLRATWQARPDPATGSGMD